MKIKQEEVHRICRLILERLKEKKLIILKTAEEKVYQALVSTFIKNLQEEEDIEEKARKILEESSQEGIDSHKMLLMIKRKIAKERNFIL